MCPPPILRVMFELIIGLKYVDVVLVGHGCMPDEVVKSSSILTLHSSIHNHLASCGRRLELRVHAVIALIMADKTTR